MPLLDHFHPPLSDLLPWESFLANWATRLADQLTERVSREFVVAEYVIGNGRAEVDVASYEEPSAWAPEAPKSKIPVVYTNAYEIRVFATSGGLTLVAVIVLVTPPH